ncbi:aldo/keto reductase family protein [Amycolatopsis echigonensis]|uniref:Aldo/keto reductase family protein n=1 Tax=Amycolatopsis echigonensis TaxID=2576905 RepID=A0A2N3X240_9PSEU|nr:aldo/keto reductase [Amycolatopsis niigatensis]PKW00187.1 aldo/keto reductase family protein [Amycolatopsis niigatensis]
MRYQTFGRQSGLRISEYVLGTSNFGSAPAAAGLAGAKAIFEDFVAAGGTTFDVSNIAQNGEAETVLGELLGRDRDEFVVITKYTATSQPDRRPTATGNSRKSMIRSLEESLRRLKTDYVDVFMPPYLSGMSAVREDRRMQVERVWLSCLLPVMVQSAVPPAPPPGSDR